MSQPIPSLAASRDSRIDLLRGVAILVVLLLHFTLSYRLAASPLTLVLPKPLLRALLVNGNFGVTMFFTISGFLITSMAVERHGRLGAVAVGRFYGFRLARILPSLAAAMAIIVVLAALGWRSFQNLGGVGEVPGMGLVLLSVFTFWHNVLMGIHGYFNYAVNIYWSLSVEEVFYLLFPLACAILKRGRYLLLLCALAVLAGPIYRSRHLADDVRYLYGYLACFDAIAMGCAAAILAPRIHLRGWSGKAIQAAALLLVSVTYLRGIEGHVVFSFTLVAFGTAILLLGARAGATGRIATSPALGWLRWLGRHSYELYLFHIIVLGMMRGMLPPAAMGYAAKPLWLGVYLGLSGLLAALVARFYSEPMNRFLRRTWTGAGKDRVAP